MPQPAGRLEIIWEIESIALQGYGCEAIHGELQVPAPDVKLVRGEPTEHRRAINRDGLDRPLRCRDLERQIEDGIAHSLVAV